MDDKDELRSQLIAALMTAEDYDYEAAARIVGEFEQRICRYCGSRVDDQASVLANTIWA